MIEDFDGRSHAQLSAGKEQSDEEVVEEEVLKLVKCHAGVESVKTVMKVCWASNTQAKETKKAWKSWAALVLEILFF